MRIGDAFPSKYLRAGDLKGKRPVVTITRVTRERLRGTDRLVVGFAEGRKLLVLNLTNATKIATLLGSDETDEWAGKQIRLFEADVPFQGGTTRAIRVASGNGEA